jgi:hypothetical protein
MFVPGIKVQMGAVLGQKPPHTPLEDISQMGSSGRHAHWLDALIKQSDPVGQSPLHIPLLSG